MANTDWYSIKLKKEELLADVSTELKEKYMDVAGIYVIYIQDELVYVGQSSSLLNRWIAHKINTLFDFGQKDYQEEKYAVLREAYKRKLNIRCELLEACENNKIILTTKEREWIDKLHPILNGGKCSMVEYKGFLLLDRIAAAA